MKHRIAEQATMTAKATNRWSAYLTDEQDAATTTAMQRAGYTSASDWLRDLIQAECERQGISWPQADLRWGDANRIERIRKLREKDA